VTDWAELRDVYGSAAAIPALLADAALTTDWAAPVWNELWGRLCHQGTVSPASYAALPALAQIAESRADVALDPAIFLAASIIASTDGPPEATDVRSVYRTQIETLRPVAEHKLELVHERVDVIYALQVVAAFEDLSIWQRRLEGLVDAEVELECPSCGDSIDLALVNGAFPAMTDPGEIDGARPRRQAEPTELGTAEARLLSLCHTYRHTVVANELLQLFGQTRCPNCGALVSIAEALS